MKILFIGAIHSAEQNWEEVLSTNFPDLITESCDSLALFFQKPPDERTLLIVEAKEIIDQLSLCQELDHDFFSLIASGPLALLRQIQESGLPLSGTLVDPWEGSELIDYIQGHLLAYRPQEIDETFFADEISSEEPMAKKEIEVDELVLDDDFDFSESEGEDEDKGFSLEADDGGLDLPLGDDDQDGTLSLSTDDDDGTLSLSTDDDDGELVLDSSSLDETDISLDGDVEDIELSDDESEALDLSASDDSDEDNSEVNLSFGELDLDDGSQKEDQSDEVDEDEISFASPPEVEEESTDSSLLFDMPESKPSIKAQKADDDDDEDFLMSAAAEVEANEGQTQLEDDEDDDDEIFGDSLDFSSDDDENEQEGTAEFSLDDEDEDDEAQLSADDDGETTDAISIPDDLPADDIPAPMPEKGQTKTFYNTAAEKEGGVPSVTHMVRDKIDYNFDENEMVRLQVTLRSLKEEREKLLTTIDQQKHLIEQLEQNNLGLKAEVDDQSIEISLLKKRFGERSEEAAYQIRLSEEKKSLYDEKMRKMQHEFEQLNQKVRLDLTRVKQREKELESQLELIKMDADAQIKGRDQKIMELKRKIDALEFNMENIAIREQQMKEERVFIEGKVQKLMTTLKGSMKILEDDYDPFLKDLVTHSLKKDEDKL